MGQRKPQQLQYVGGPLDGHVGEFQIPLQSPLLAKTGVFQVRNPDRFRNSSEGEQSEVRFRVALYELKLIGARLGYRFAGFALASESKSASGSKWILAPVTGGVAGSITVDQLPT